MKNMKNKNGKPMFGEVCTFKGIVTFHDKGKTTGKVHPPTVKDEKGNDIPAVPVPYEGPGPKKQPRGDPMARMRKHWWMFVLAACAPLTPMGLASADPSLRLDGLRVVDEGGRVPRSAWAELYLQNIADCEPIGDRRCADQEGWITLPAFDLDALMVVVGADGMAPKSMRCSSASGREVVLQSGRRVDVVVRDIDTNEAIVGAEVMALDQPSKLSATTDGSGKASLFLGGSEERPTHVRAEKEGYQLVELVRTAGGSVAVRMQRRNPRRVDLVGMPTEQIPQVITCRRGAAVSRLAVDRSSEPPGVVVPYDDRLIMLSTEDGSTATVSMRREDDDRCQVKLELGATIRGRIADTNMSGVAGVLVKVFHDERLVAWAFTGGDGGYEVAIPPLDYAECRRTMVISAPGYATQRRGVDSRPGEVSRIDVELPMEAIVVCKLSEDVPSGLATATVKVKSGEQTIALFARQFGGRALLLRGLAAGDVTVFGATDGATSGFTWSGTTSVRVGEKVELILSPD